jgi:hypothetical protein
MAHRLTLSLLTKTNLSRMEEEEEEEEMGQH